MTNKLDVSKLSGQEIEQLRQSLKITERSKHWDWSKTTAELSKEHGIATPYVSTLRGRHGKGKVTKHWPACKHWNWKLSNTEISRQQRVPICVVVLYRAKLGKPEVHNRALLPSPIADVEIQSRDRTDYGGVDWQRQSDTEISKLLGVTRERARQKRAELGLPKRYLCQLRYERFVELFGKREALSFDECKEKMEAHPGFLTFSKWCAKAGIKRVLGKGGSEPIHPWHLVDWRLPNALLQSIWRIKSKNAVAVVRANYNHGKAVFWCLHGNYKPEYKPLVKAQMMAAAKHFASK